MNYYFTKTIDKSFDDARLLIEIKLKEKGFGIVSELNLQKKFKEKLNVDFRRYTIMGACSPKHAHKAISMEDKIGVFLPCNVILQEAGKGKTEVTVVDPIASMQAVKNSDLADVAKEIQDSLSSVIESL